MVESSDAGEVTGKFLNNQIVLRSKAKSYLHG